MKHNLITQAKMTQIPRRLWRLKKCFKDKLHMNPLSTIPPVNFTHQIKAFRKNVRGEKKTIHSREKDFQNPTLKLAYKHL